MVVIDGMSGGNDKGTVTKITSLIPSATNNKNNELECEWWDGEELKYHTMTENISDLRKATPEEETLYKERYGKEEN